MESELEYKESWAPKNWCFWTVVLEKTLESPLDCNEIQPVPPKGNQSWIFIGGLMLKMKLQYFGHLMWRTDSLEKTLKLRKIEGGKRRGQQRMRWLDGITDSINMSLSKLWELVMDREACMLQPMGLQRVRHNQTTELKWLIIGLVYLPNGLLQWFLKWLSMHYQLFAHFLKPCLFIQNFFFTLYPSFKTLFILLYIKAASIMKSHLIRVMPTYFKLLQHFLCSSLCLLCFTVIRLFLYSWKT